jgi:hypothetical protein
MGKEKRYHNWKAREQKNVSIDRSDEKKVIFILILVIGPGPGCS